MAIINLFLLCIYDNVYDISEYTKGNRVLSMVNEICSKTIWSGPNKI